MADFIRTSTEPRARAVEASSVIDEDARSALGLELGLAAKRVIDLAGSACLLVVLSPLLLLIGIIVRLGSPGPSLFLQERIGRGGVPFTFYKFRTMAVDNDPSVHRQYVEKLIAGASDDLAGDNGSFKIEDDPRVTRFGRILRRTSLDELPQLVNVLKGEMSLVGPRPPLRYEVELYSNRAMRRLDCAPGITGLWQVTGRCQTTFDEMVELDLEYLDRWSLALDLEIMARTIPVVLGRKGAW